MTKDYKLHEIKYVEILKTSSQVSRFRDETPACDEKYRIPFTVSHQVPDATFQIQKLLQCWIAFSCILTS